MYLKYDPRIIGKTQLAKKIRGCKFTDLIGDMNTKGHPVPTNAAGEPHCLSWHLREKYKIDYYWKADHNHAPAVVINPLIEWCTIALA